MQYISRDKKEIIEEDLLMTLKNQKVSFPVERPNGQNQCPDGS
jgi:hypothetical protein